MTQLTDHRGCHIQKGGRIVWCSRRWWRTYHHRWRGAKPVQASQENAWFGDWKRKRSRTRMRDATIELKDAWGTKTRTSFLPQIARRRNRGAENFETQHPQTLQLACCAVWPWQSTGNPHNLHRLWLLTDDHDNSCNINGKNNGKPRDQVKGLEIISDGGTTTLPAQEETPAQRIKRLFEKNITGLARVRERFAGNNCG